MKAKVPFLAWWDRSMPYESSRVTVQLAVWSRVGGGGGVPASAHTRRGSPSPE